jgi:hypothetical protein
MIVMDKAMVVHTDTHRNYDPFITVYLYLFGNIALILYWIQRLTLETQFFSVGISIDRRVIHVSIIMSCPPDNYNVSHRLFRWCGFFCSLKASFKSSSGICLQFVCSSHYGRDKDSLLFGWTCLSRVSCQRQNTKNMSSFLLLRMIGQNRFSGFIRSNEHRQPWFSWDRNY